MEMTFGRFHFRVGKEGSHHLVIPDSSRSVPVDSDSSGLASLFESGEEEISPSIFTKSASSGKLSKIFSGMSFGSSADSNISIDLDNFDFIDRSTSVREVLADLYDGVTDPDENQTSKYHQVYVIGESSRPEAETSEAFDDVGNPYVDPADLMRGLGTKYVGPGTRQMVQLPQASWDRAARAMNVTELMNTTATAEELQAYQYKLAHAGRELEKQRIELEKRRAAASASSRRRAELSRQSGTSGDNHRDARNRGRSRMQNIPEGEREHLIQNLDMSFMSIDTRGNIIPKTPEAGYIATQAYILASKPPAGDPREELYNMAMAGVGVMGTAFASTITPPEGTAKQNSPRPTVAVQDPPRTSTRDTATQARVDRARQERRERRHSPEVDEEDMCGLPCFTRRVRKMRVPSGFKLPDNYKKFDDLQDPEDWLVDYLEIVKLTGGTKATAMQSIQIGKNVQVYIDDVVITTKQGSTLIEDLKENFDNLDRFCLKLNPTKCSFGVPAGELLGFLVSARGIEANPEKIQAIVTMRKSTKLKEIQQLTGRVAALSKFIARLGEKALPFYALIKQGEKFQWNKEADRAFEDLKRTISTPPILVAPKEKQPLLLYIAATPQVVSTVMNQCNVVNDNMIAYKEVYNELEKLFDGYEVNHISRLSNDEADILANIGSQCLAIPPGVFWEEINERSTKVRKQSKKKKKLEKDSGALVTSEGSISGDEEDPHEILTMFFKLNFG
ncbi:hypothetical protein QYE76_061391 [Lolium multiflorum]|uniref:Uncharacterized protein n=1 Tax=Lolium multiflorum TaxID=4521 RepID=A0AAD8S220_LOLMU|nr:hypothetical protein QYE76_061391 [Lolium multiflorum]